MSTSLTPNNITCSSGGLTINIGSGSTLSLPNNNTISSASVSCTNIGATNISCNKLSFGNNYFQNSSYDGIGLQYVGSCMYINAVNNTNNIPNGFFETNDASRFADLNNNGNVGGGGVSYPFNGTNYGLNVKGRIGCGEEIDVFSDIRIKNNILDISSEVSLNIIRKLQPKTFNYIDKPNNKQVYGFIAQEVDKVFSDCVNKIYNFIPNIYQYSKIIDKNTLTFLDFSTDNLIANSLKIKLYINNSEKIVTIKEIINNVSFSIDENLSEEFCFVYGQEIHDFHLMEKNAVFTLTTSAVKQLDIELQETKKIVNKQQNEIENLKNEIADLKTILK
jgi:hypothetical protein